jgi:hypothetical protein
MSIALITSAIKPNAVDDTNLVDHIERLNQTRDAILEMIHDKTFDRIVIADGSNTTPFTAVEVEQVVFEQDREAVRIRGKSFGELQIMDYALSHSNLIRESGYFYKLSGRYTISNIKVIIDKIQKYQNVFFFNSPPFVPGVGRFASTILYKCSVDFFREVFDGAQDECSYEVEGYLEAVFFRRLVALRRKRRFVAFPWYNAVSGTTGRKAINRRYVIRDVASRFGLLCWSYD